MIALLGLGGSLGLWTATAAPEGDAVPLLDLDVTAEQQARDLLDAPRRVEPSLAISQSSIDQAAMQQQGARVVTDALRYQPGTWTERRGRKVKAFTSYRGQYYPHPDFAWNSVWLPEFHEMPYLTPITALERIDITRSAASLFMGVSGDAGVIDLIPRAPRGPAHVMLRAASHGTGELAFFAPWRGPSGGVALAGGYFHTDGPSGRHAHENLLHGMVSGAWQPTPTAQVSLQVLGLRSDRELMRARPPAGRRLQETQERYDPFQALLVGLRADLDHADAAGTSLGLVGAWRDNDFVNEGPGGHVAMREKDYSLTLDLTHTRPLSDANRLRLGAVYNHYAAPEGKRFIEGRRVDYDTLALSIGNEHLFGPVLVDGGIRVSRRYLRDYAGFSVDGSSRGLENVEAIRGEWERPRVRAAAGARWFVTPAFESFVHAGIDRIEPRAGTLDVNMESPDAETRFNGELGLRHTTRAGMIAEWTSFAVHRRKGLLLDGSTALTPAGQELERYRNQDLRQLGAEAGIRDVPVMAGMTAFASITYVRSEAKEEAQGYRRFIEIPQWIGAAGLETQHGPWAANVYLEAVSRYRSRRFAGDGEFHPLGDFVDVQARLARRLTDLARLTLTVENVLDDAYSTVVGYPDTGRRYGVQLDLAW